MADATIKQISDNTESTHLKKFLGLHSDKEYTDTSKLRYGKIMIMTDQDAMDPILRPCYQYVFILLAITFENDGFITSMITPIVKVTKNKKVYHSIILLIIMIGKSHSES